MDESAHGTVPAPGAAGLPSGRLGMWVFLASEAATFGGLVTIYLLSRLRHPEWAGPASHTLLPVGTVNTFLLLTSSLTMVLAHHGARAGDAGAARRWLRRTAGLGLLFLGLKALEYSHEIAAGNVPASGGFWTFYFCLTGLHGLHVLAGILVLVLLAGSRSATALARVPPAGLYWHFVDLVWIFLFPLLYVTTR